MLAKICLEKGGRSVNWDIGTLSLQPASILRPGSGESCRAGIVRLQRISWWGDTRLQAKPDAINPRAAMDQLEKLRRIGETTAKTKSANRTGP